MSRWKRKRRIWLIRHAQKLQSRKYRINKTNKIVHSLSSDKPLSQSISDRSPLPVRLTPPENFSLTTNPEETMAFFANFADEIDRKRKDVMFYIDSSKVKYATVDALIYLIAIIQNDIVNAEQNYSFVGNYPKNSEAYCVYAESGFNDYVYSKKQQLPDSNDKMRIISGINNDPASAKELSDFVMKSLNKQRKDIQPLQKVLIELMSNVYHHAYEKNTFMAKKWYMYAEHVDNYVRCVFVDTGFGISSTARKKLKEKLVTLFGGELDDSKIIQSIFNGDFRTATNEPYRGNGLSTVRENVNSDLFEEFEVLSGKGRCTLSKNEISNYIIGKCYDNKLYGTLYQFLIK